MLNYQRVLLVNLLYLPMAAHGCAWLRPEARWSMWGRASKWWRGRCFFPLYGHFNRENMGKWRYICILVFHKLNNGFSYVFLICPIIFGKMSTWLFSLRWRRSSWPWWRKRSMTMARKLSERRSRRTAIGGTEAKVSRFCCKHIMTNWFYVYIIMIYIFNLMIITDLHICIMYIIIEHNVSIYIVIYIYIGIWIIHTYIYIYNLIGISQIWKLYSAKLSDCAGCSRLVSTWFGWSKNQENTF